MLGDTTPPRRRKLPVLGMTTVGLAVGAGSLGLYRGAPAVPLGPPDQPTWTTAEVRNPAPPPPSLTAVAAEGPAVPPPAVPTLPNLPLFPDPVTPAKAGPPPVELPALPAPVMPVTPAGPLLPAMPSLGVPDLVKPIEIAPVPRAEAEVAPTPRPHPEAPAATSPVAPFTQPVQIAPPAGPIGPAPIDYPLPPSQPGFKFNGSPEVAPGRVTTGALTSLDREHPGETPVIPTRQALKSAALGVALAVTPVTAAEPPATMPKSDAPKTEPAKDDPLAELKKQVDALRKDTNLEKDFRKLTDDAVMGKLNKETNKTEPGLVTKFDELDARLKKLEKSLEKLDVSKFEEAVARLEKKLDAANNSTIAQKPDAAAKPMPGPAATTPPGPAILGPKATVRIVNEYPVPISMMVNGSSHRVEPSASKYVDVPAGSYTYELLHSGSQATTATIKENDSVTLRIK